MIKIINRFKDLFRRRRWYECIWTIRYEHGGEVIWRQEKRNHLADEGEQNMLDTYFRALNAPIEFYVRLAQDVIVDTDTLADILGEPSGNGYSAKIITRDAVGFPVMELNLGDYRVVSKEVSFTASGGDIGPINTVYLATTSDNTGKLLCYLALSLERTILQGDEAFISLRIKLK